MTWFLGFEEDTSEEEQVIVKEENKSVEKMNSADDNMIVAPISGEVKALSECPDAVFSGGMLGDGVIIEPKEGKVFAPCNGSVENIFDTKHAIGLVADNGAEILIHVGLDTATLGGKGFTAHVKDGDKITKGQLLLEFDIDYITSKGLPIVTPVVISNLDTFAGNSKELGMVNHSELIIKLDR